MLCFESPDNAKELVSPHHHNCSQFVEIFVHISDTRLLVFGNFKKKISTADAFISNDVSQLFMLPKQDLCAGCASYPFKHFIECSNQTDVMTAGQVTGSE